MTMSAPSSTSSATSRSASSALAGSIWWLRRSPNCGAELGRLAERTVEAEQYLAAYAMITTVETLPRREPRGSRRRGRPSCRTARRRRAPASRMRQRRRHELLDRRIVARCRRSKHDAAMAVRGVLAEAHVGDDDQCPASACEWLECLLHRTVLVVGRTRRLVLVRAADRTAAPRERRRPAPRRPPSRPRPPTAGRRPASMTPAAAPACPRTRRAAGRTAPRTGASRVPARESRACAAARRRGPRRSERVTGRRHAGLDVAEVRDQRIDQRRDRRSSPA